MNSLNSLTAVGIEDSIENDKTENNTKQKRKLTDADLVLSFQRGNVEAFKELVKRHEQKVISLALSYMRNEQDAKDIYQEAFIRVFKSLHKFEFRSQFSTWLHRIVVNLCLTYISSNKAVPFSSLANDEDSDDSSLTDILTQTSDSSTDVDSRFLIEKALSSLNPRQRLFFVLKHVEGYKLEEIAELNGTTIGAVKKTLFVALAKVRFQITQNS